MRVLHINSTIVVNSGVMSVLMNYYRHIDREKVQFDFLYFSKSKFQYKTYEDEILALGGKVFYVDDFKKILAFNKKVEELLKKNPYHTVHIHDSFVVGFLYGTLRKNGVKNIIVHSHSTKWSDKKINGIRNKILCLNLLKHIDYAFACSKAAGDFLYGDRCDFYVMNNAIELDRYAFDESVRGLMRAKYRVSDNIVFGHVGNICAQKNHTFLIDVFSEIVKRNPNARLLLVGDGVLRENIQQKVKNLKLEDKVLFLGKKTNVQDYYQMMDCMILPSLYEGLPMVGVEAQCSGLPVLFADTITKEVGNASSAYLSLTDSPLVWAKKALELCNCEDRNQGKLIMKEMGFDIERESRFVEKKYLEMEKDMN